LLEVAYRVEIHSNVIFYSWLKISVMEKSLWYILSAIGVILILILPGKLNYVGMHPSLSSEAQRPDIYFNNVAYYLKEKSFDRSLKHLDKAIASIQKIKNDLNAESKERLDGAIDKLEILRSELMKDSVLTDKMKGTFEYALNTLACAELNISEMYTESDQRKLANIALKHAQLHLKNAMTFKGTDWNDPNEHRKIEMHVFLEVDSLLENQWITQAHYSARLDHILDEMNQLIEEGY
jgi:tetratricopeptide (TPR) repeat protein